MKVQINTCKLGYGGTKTEMERLLADAEKLTGKKYDIQNLGDVYDAIHVIQGELGLTGVAAAEAEGTFTGSMGAMAAATKNLMGNLALGEDIQPSLEIMATSIRTFVGNNMLPMLGNILKGVPKLVSVSLSEILKTVNMFINKLFGEGKFLEDGFKNNLTVLVDSALEVIGDIVEAVISAMPYFTEAALKLVRGVVETLWNYDWAGAMQGFISNLSESLSLAAQEILGTDDPGKIISMIAQGINTYLPKLLAMGAEVITNLVAGISSVANQMPDILGKIGQMAVQFLKQIDWIGLGKALINMIDTGIGALASLIPTLLKSIGTTALNAFKAIDWKSVGAAAVNFIIDGYISLRTNVVNTLKNIGQSALNGFKSIDWKGVGSAIINGIISGISGAAGALYNKLRGLAHDALNAAKSALGISSPSKVFAKEVGQWIPAGMAQGIEDNADVLNRAVAGISEDSVNALNGQLDGEAIAAGGGTVIYNTFTINAPAGMDVRELADVVVARMTLAEQQRAAVWGSA